MSDIGTEKERVLLWAAASEIIRTVLEKPIVASKYPVRKDWLAPPKLEAFRRLEPVGFDADDKPDWWRFSPEDCQPDLVWPLDSGVITAPLDDQGLILNRTYSISAKDARGIGRQNPTVLFLARVTKTPISLIAE